MNAPSVEPVFITTHDTRHAEGQTSGVSWAAVLAGAVAAASLSLLLLILGFGLGLSAVSPWAYNVAAIGASTVVWLAFTQLIASGLGGYLAGRLRVKWSNVHGDETYFRDTAHGLLAWSIAALMSVVLLASAAHAILGTAISTGETVAGAIAPTAMMAANDATTVADAANPMNYFADMLLRSDAKALPQPAIPQKSARECSRNHAHGRGAHHAVARSATPASQPGFGACCRTPLARSGPCQRTISGPNWAPRASRPVRISP